MIPEESITRKAGDGRYLEGGQDQNQPDQQPGYLPTYGGIEPPPPYVTTPPPDSSDNGGDLTGPFASKQVQIQFTRKVFAIQSVQLLVATAIVGAFTYNNMTGYWACKSF